MSFEYGGEIYRERNAGMDSIIYTPFNLIMPEYIKSYLASLGYDFIYVADAGEFGSFQIWNRLQFVKQGLFGLEEVPDYWFLQVERSDEETLEEYDTDFTIYPQSKMPDFLVFCQAHRVGFCGLVALLSGFIEKFGGEIFLEDGSRYDASTIHKAKLVDWEGNLVADCTRT